MVALAALCVGNREDVRIAAIVGHTDSRNRGEEKCTPVHLHWRIGSVNREEQDPAQPQ
jgi:hypothetical protein